MLGFTLQSNHRFTEHIKVKLQEANKCLYGIRCLGKEGHLQRDVDYVFRSTNVRSSCIRLLNTPINNGPEFFNSAALNANTFRTKLTYICNVLEEVDRSLFKRISSMPGHPLYPSVPKTKESSARFRVPSSQLSRVNTQRFKNRFF